jgi:hypothetical protein
VIGCPLNVVANVPDVSANAAEGVAASADEGAKNSGEEHESQLCF